MKLKNRTILITGGSRGIGLEFAKQLTALGNQVLMTSRSQNSLRQLRDTYPAIQSFPLDLSQKDFLDNLSANPHPLLCEVDVLINNAGVGHRLNLTQPLSAFDLSNEIQVNLGAPIQLINFLLPQLLEKQSSAIVNITSALAFSPFAAVPIYSATKAGFRSYTMSLRNQLKESPIKVFEIAPPTTDTEMLNGFHRSDLKGVKPIGADEMVKQSLAGIMNDTFEICPGKSKQLKTISRWAPNFIFNQMNKNLNMTENL